MGKGRQGERAMECVAEPEHVHTSRVIGGLVATCTYNVWLDDFVNRSLSKRAQVELTLNGPE